MVAPNSLEATPDKSVPLAGSLFKERPRSQVTVLVVLLLSYYYCYVIILLADAR